MADTALAIDHSVPVLEVHDLAVRLHHGGGTRVILEGVSYTVMPASSVALVGESGAGKSVSVRAVLDLLDSRRFEVTGSIRFCGTEITTMSSKQRRRYVSSVASLVFQDPTRSLNPSMRVGLQISEAMRFVPHREPLEKEEAHRRAVQLMRDVGIADPEERYYAYPHQLSGGMRQRIVIAIALSCDPKVVFCDEPTSSLDVTTQALIMDLLEGLRDRFGISVVLITHDLALASSRVSEIMVMLSGRLVETVPAAVLFDRASMPYTRALLRAVPNPDSGTLSTPLPPAKPGRQSLSVGCVYSRRCERADDRCLVEVPELVELEEGHSCRCWLPGAFDGPAGEVAVDAMVRQ